MNDLVLDAMRLAEFAHRKGDQRRKAPEGEDRPAYFIHLAEVAWMLQEARAAPEVVAAGFLHDMIEDCGYTRARLERETGSRRLAEMVEWVSEPAKSHSWEERNQVYLERMQAADDEVLALSCADKTANLRDMNRLLGKGYAPEHFTSRDHATQLAKFDALGAIYRGRVPATILERFERALARFRDFG